MREYLEYVRSLSTRVEVLREQIERKRSLLDATGVVFSEKVSGTTQAGDIADAIADLKGLVEDFAAELVVYTEQQRMAYIAFSMLSTAERARALTLYYLEGKPWEEICVDMNYSWDGMMSLRRRSAKELYDHIPQEWKLNPEEREDR